MKFIGLLRVKDVENWITEVIDALIPLCDKILVFDDHSTDNTINLCKRATIVIYKSPFDTFDESRDKTWLLTKAIETENPDWAIMVDGDEVLEEAGPAKIKQRIISEGTNSFSLPVPYFWNNTDTVRVDGSFGRMAYSGRASIFKVAGLTPDTAVYNNLGYANYGLHCGNIPRVYVGNSPTLNAALWHYGWMNVDVRRRKFDYYTSVDSSRGPDEHLHALIGDPGGPPADAVVGHAGPLSLVPVSQLCNEQGLSRKRTYVTY
jgi:glycosyltransferase involved in cell wall biosynthesis